MSLPVPPCPFPQKIPDVKEYKGVISVPRDLRSPVQPLTHELEERTLSNLSMRTTLDTAYCLWRKTILILIEAT